MSVPRAIKGSRPLLFRSTTAVLFPLSFSYNSTRLHPECDVATIAPHRIQYNDFLTLAGIPAEVFEYRLGNRSALEWVIDQYRVRRDEHGQIMSDPNRNDDEQYIVRLLGQVITVSLETNKIVAGLPAIEE